MRFIKWLGISVLLIVALFLIIPLFLSSAFHIERSIHIKKPVDIVFQTAIDMNQRAKWDPWIELDPKVELNVITKPEIIGSGYSWKGEIIGEGKIEINEFVPNEKIKSKIEFIAPQKLKSDVIWTFAQSNDGTDISWAFEGSLSYPLERWFGLFMDKSLGTQFEKGLSNFKTLVESLPDLRGRTGEIKETYYNGLKAISIKEPCDLNKLSSKMFDMYTTLMLYLRQNNLEMSGAPFAIHYESQDEGFTILECGLPVDKKIVGKDQIKYIEIPAGKVVMASHFGHFNTVKTTYEAVQKYLTENNLQTNGSPWEVYITDPTRERDQNKWETQIYFPIK